MKEYSYMDLVNTGWISPDHGFNAITLTMLCVFAFGVLITVISGMK